MLGTQVGSYQVTGKIAEGGMGVVYRAQHSLIGKTVAIKVLLPEYSVNQEIVNRFFNEARAATAIRHPGIVEIFDFGYLPNGMAYLVMEYLEGEALAARLRRLGRIDERAALAVVRAVASALAAAHGKGIVHRDLKPDNIFMVPDPDMPGGERAKILDFGIAKLTDGVGGGSQRTRTGALMGTPMYMSPEQCRGAGVLDHRSDLYSLGCILYEMLTGRPPFVSEGVGEVMGGHMYFPPDPPSKHAPAVSQSVETLTLQLLAKRPEDRPASAADLARLLGQGSVPSADAFATVVLASAAPTTLSGAAAETAAAGEVARPRGRGRIAAAGALVVVAAAVIAFAATRGGSAEEQATGNGKRETGNAEPEPAKPEPEPAKPEPAKPEPPKVEPEIAETTPVEPTPEPEPPKKPKKKKPRKKESSGTSAGSDLVETTL